MPETKFRIDVLEKDVTDIKLNIKEHDKILKAHDIKFTEHTKDFEALNHSIKELNNTMKTFVKEMKDLKNQPLAEAQYYKRLVFSTILTGILGIVIGYWFKIN